MVTTKYYFVKEEGTCLVTDKNDDLNSKGERYKSMGSKEEVGLPMLGVIVGLKFKAGDGKAVAEIVRKGGMSIVGSGA